MAKGKFSQPRSGGNENDRFRSDHPLKENRAPDSPRVDTVKRPHRKIEDETAPLPSSAEESAAESDLDSFFLPYLNDNTNNMPSGFPQEQAAPDLIEPVPEVMESMREAMPDSEDGNPEEIPFSEKLVDFLESHRKASLITFCAAAAVLILGIVLLFTKGSGSGSDPYGNRILSNVTVAGVNVGGMTRSEAVQAVKRATKDTFSKTDMAVQLPEESLSLSPSKTGAKLDVQAAVEAAFAYGRTGSQEQQQRDYQASLTGNHTIGLLPYLTLDKEYIQAELKTFGDKYAGFFTQSGYALEGQQPNLKADQYDPSAPGQTLVLTVGSPGLGLDLNDLYDRVMDAYSLNVFFVEMDSVSVSSEPEPLDLNAIYEEVYVAPIDGTVDPETYESIPGSYGYGFDLESAKELLASSQYGDVLRIPMEYVEPEILENAYFLDELGSCQTPHTSNENRNTNLRLACQTLDGLILQPGETFSYNETLGQRTSEKGYKKAPAYSGHELVDTVGGGVCQVSSTLYWCTLLSDLEIVDRINHGYPASYMEKGLDATVSWNGPDFKFKNNSDFPIKILAEVSDGYVKMRIMGTDQRNYYVKMESVVTGTKEPETVYEEHGPEDGYYDGEVLEGGKTGYYVKTYRCKYDKQTDKLISRDYETMSSYLSKNKIVVKIVNETVATPVTDPTEDPGTVPTDPAPTDSNPTDPPSTDPAPTDQPPTDPSPTTAPPTDPAPTENAGGDEGGQGEEP